VHREVIDLSQVVAPSGLRSRVMAVRTAGRKANSSSAQPSGLALDASQLDTIIDNQVTARVLSERQEHCVARVMEHEHHCEGRSIADGLRMHARIVAAAADGPRPRGTVPANRCRRSLSGNGEDASRGPAGLAGAGAPCASRAGARCRSSSCRSRAPRPSARTRGPRGRAGARRSPGPTGRCRG
jgi:hypothetical protein